VLPAIHKSPTDGVCCGPSLPFLPLEHFNLLGDYDVDAMQMVSIEEVPEVKQPPATKAVPEVEHPTVRGSDDSDSDEREFFEVWSCGSIPRWRIPSVDEIAGEAAPLITIYFVSFLIFFPSISMAVVGRRSLRRLLNH